MGGQRAEGTTITRRDILPRTPTAPPWVLLADRRTHGGAVGVQRKLTRTVLAIRIGFCRLRRRARLASHHDRRRRVYGRLGAGAHHAVAAALADRRVPARGR